MHLPEVNRGESVSLVAMSGTGFYYLLDYERGYRRPTDHVWAINSAGVWYRGVDMIVAMDDLRRDAQDHEKLHHDRYVDNLVATGLPILTCTAYPEYPTTIEYPLREVVESIWPRKNLKTFGARYEPRPVLDNSVNYAIAYALYCKAGKIALYGCDFVRPDDHVEIDRYRRTHPHYPDWFAYYKFDAIERRMPGEPGSECCSYLLGVAAQRGVEIYIPPGSTLLNCDRPHYWYGFDREKEPTL